MPGTQDEPPSVSELRGFRVRFTNRVWRQGGVVHNDENPCSHAPDGSLGSDLATVISDEHELCDYCDWPEGAEEAIQHGN